MNGALKWKLIAGFVLVFVAGGIAGAALGGFYARHLFFDGHRPGRLGDRMKERLRTELRLTPEQVAKVSPIVDKTATQLREIRRDTGRRVHQIMTEAHKENLPARGEVLPQIAQEKIPFRCSPAFLSRVIKIEIRGKRSDPIEFLTKVGQ